MKKERERVPFVVLFLHNVFIIYESKAGCVGRTLAAEAL
ncbi:MAG: hypothetical protein RLZZ480_15 [Candidatus Parcubacteria bacterium]|jgi:hypothetical protein